LLESQIRHASNPSAAYGKIDVAVLTETKMTHPAQRAAWVTDIQADGAYKLYFSNVGARRRGPGARGPRGGVAIALSAALAQTARIVTPPSPDLLGHVLEIDILLPDQQILKILGVYVPTDGLDARLANAVYDHIEKVSAACAANGSHFLCGGDLNAVLLPGDRTGRRSPRDRRWQSTCQRAGISPAFPTTTPRTHTFRPPGPGRSDSARLDDWLVTASSALARAVLPPLTVDGSFADVLGCFYHTSDHAPVACVVDVALLGSALPVLFQQHAAPVLCRPTKDSLASFATLCEELGPPAALHARVLELLAAPSASSEDISALTPAIREWTSALYDVAVRACGVYVPSTEHHRHRTRRMKRVHLSHVRTAAFMQSAITLSLRQPPGWRTDVCFAQLSREHPDLALPSLLDDADDPSELALFTTSDYTDRAHVAERLRGRTCVCGGNYP
jgi:hypothetical protein